MNTEPPVLNPARPRWLHWVLLALVFSPALFTAHLVWEKSVDVGTWDMWENALLLEKWHNGTLTWHDLYAPQIQHRIVVPRLIILAMTHLSGGDFRWEHYADYLLIAANSALLWLLLKRTMGANAWRWPLMFAFNLLLFSPMHYQNLLWGSSMWSAMPMPCLLGTILVLSPRADAGGSWWRFTVAVVLAETATHSFAHGLAIWPVMLGIILINPVLGTLRHRFVLSGIGAAIATVTIACYFTDFINVAYHAYDLKPGDHALSGGKNIFADDNLRIAIRFFFAFLGTWFARTPFAGHPLEAAVVLGQWSFVIFASVAIFTLRHKLTRSTLPWLALAAYVLLVGLMVSKRGADIGDHRAVTPRYLAVSQYLLIAGISMTATLGTVFRRTTERWRAGHPNGDNDQSGLARTTGIILLTAFCTAQIPVWRYGLHLTDVWHHARRQAQALLIFLPHVQDQGRLISMETLDKESANWHCINAVNTLLRLGLLRTRPVETPELKWFSQETMPLPTQKADVTAAKILDDGTLELQGHARFQVGRPVDAVLIVQNDHVISLGQPSPQHVLRIYGLDYEFSNATDVHVSGMYPWRARVKLTSLDAPLELWALDVTERRISRIAADITFDATAKTAGIRHP